MRLQLAVHMRIIISNNNNYGTRPGYGTVRDTLPLGNFPLLYTALHLLHRGFCTLVLFIYEIFHLLVIIHVMLYGSHQEHIILLCAPAPINACMSLSS